MNSEALSQRRLLISKILRVFIITAVICLASLIYYYPIRNHVPPGVDSSVYINDVRWILSHHHLPPHQIITHGLAAYPSPGTEIVVASIVLLTNLPITTVFVYYQLFLIIMLFLTTYLVGTLFSKKLALFFIFLLLGSFSLYRLYIGSTISNLMAFSLMNLIFYYTIIISRVARKMPYVILVTILFVLLYLFHNYLSFPIFTGTFIIYLFILALTRNEFRTHLKLFFIQKSKFVLISIGLLLIGFLFFIINKYKAIGLEALWAFTSPDPHDKFQGIIEWKQIGALIGQPLWNLALIGLLMYLGNWKKNVFSWRIFPLLWLVILWILMQSYHLGVHFYFERLVFLAGVMVPYFAAIVVIKVLHSKRQAPLIVSLIITTMIISGIGYMTWLFKASNFVGNDQLTALQILAKRVTSTDLILENVNGVMETRHDVIITDGNFKYYPSLKMSCPVDDFLCYAFTSPDSKSAVEALKEARINYVLLMKPNNELNSDLDSLAQKYLNNSSVNTLFVSNNAYLFNLVY